MAKIFQIFFIIIIILVGISRLYLGLVWLIGAIPLGATLIGYYIGFFALKKIGLHEKPAKQKSLKQAICTIVLAGIFASTFLVYPILETMQYFLAGLWISLIWPIIFKKITKN